MAGDTPLGFASYGPFRSGEGYRYIVEHSVYVARHVRRRGIARALLGGLLGIASGSGYRHMIGGVSGDQPASLALHRALGFVEAGRLPAIGDKNGRRLDLVLMLRDLGA